MLASRSLQADTDLTENVSSEFEALLARVAKLERRASLEKRSGTITHADVKKGYRVDWGPGSDGKPMLSPWIKQSSHHGFTVEHTPFAIGQTVMSKGMDPEGITAVAHPHSESDANPADSAKSLTVHTYRIRKKPGTTQEPAKDDDKEDVTHQRSYDNYHTVVGEKLTRKISRKEKQILDTVGKDDTMHAAEIQQESGHTHSVNNGKHKITIHPDKGISHSVDKDDHFIKIDSKGITHSTKGSITKTAKDTISDVAKNIVHNGNTSMLGGLDVSKFINAGQGVSVGGIGISADAPGFRVDHSGRVTMVLEHCADDKAAKKAGLRIGQLYRTDNVIKIRTR